MLNEQPRELKSWVHLFQEIKAGKKFHDIRSEDNGKFHVGQKLRLREFDFVKGQYTGDSVLVEVTYITNRDTPCAFSSAVLQPGYAILSLRLV
jgi:uncharacterized protein YqfB (UPF0267 family)